MEVEGETQRMGMVLLREHILTREGENVVLLIKRYAENAAGVILQGSVQ